MIKYIAYCRRSIEQEEKQALSIEAQIAELKEFAAREKLEVVEFLTESKTAKVPGREVFGQLIKRIQQGEVQGILAWHPDRLARNSVDGGQIIYLLDTEKILDLKFPTFWFDSTPQGKFMLSIAFSQSKYYMDNLSENVKRGNRQKLRRGVYPSKAPIGYYNEPRLRTIEVDRQTAPIVRRAFEMYGTENYSMVDIQRFFFKKGIRRKKNDKMLPMSQVQKLLSNTFYYGLMKYAGEFYEGIHKPLISKNLFDKIQLVQKQRGKPRKQAHNFPFVGLVRCGECGASVTAEEHFKFYPSTRGKVAYVYYHCTKRKIRQPCSQHYLNSVEFEKQLRKLLLKVNIPRAWMEKWLEKMDQEQKTELGQVEENTAEINQKVQTVNQKLGRLLDVYLNQEVDLISYQQKKNQLLEEKVGLKEKIAEISKNGNDWFEPMKEFINVAADAAKTARAENNSQELKLLAQKVGSNYTLLNRQLFCHFKKGFAEVFSFSGAFSAAPATPRNPQMWTREVSNLSPFGCKPNALPLSYGSIQVRLV